MIRLAVIVPDRGDRPELFNNCNRMIEAQSLKPNLVFFIDYPPTDDKVDITKRYRKGYNLVGKLKIDLIAFMESDDYYAPNYLEVMVREWENAGRPELFGTSRSTYYHIVERKFIEFYHSERAPMFNTFIKPELDIIWPEDYDPYTDVWLWMTSKLQNGHSIKNAVLIDPSNLNGSQMLTLGIKHGVGKTGGEYHKTKMHRYAFEDPNLYWLKNMLDKESFDFYSKYAETLKVKI